MIDTDPEKAYYGFSHVHQADQELAIDTLLVTDDLFRSSDVVMRKKYVDLVESVREHGGSVFIFSSLHVSGKQLKQVSGVAAILRFALHLDFMDENRTESGHDFFQADAEDESDDGRKHESEDGSRMLQDLHDMGLE